MVRQRLQRAACLALALALALCLSAAASALPPSLDWTNLNIAKQIDLAGSVSHLSISATIQSNKQFKDVDAAQAAQPYYFALPADEANAVSWSRATIRPPSSSAIAASGALPAGHRPVLNVEALGPLDGDADTHLFSVQVPVAAFPQSAPGAKSTKDDGLILTLEATLNHLTKPLPATVKQTESQFLLWAGDVRVRSPYPSDSGRVKVKAAHPRIVSFEPTDDATKAGSTITFGPFSSIPAYSPKASIERGKVHYQHDLPVMSIVSLERTVEFSHWGDNLAIEDRLWLRNDGPALKGHFSRIDHQMSSFYKKHASHTLTNLAMHLPPGARDTYFIDQIGNVSTSRFRPLPAPSQPPTTPLNLLPPTRASLLELQPRFPLLGGWNYSFVVGFNLPLSKGGWLKVLPSTASPSTGGQVYSAAVPFLTPITDLAIDDATVRIVLPEGAEPVHVSLPFDVDSSEETVTKTYLDTKGRKTVVLRRKRNSERIGQLVYVHYTLTGARHLTKVAAVASVTAGLFILAAIVRRVDSRIK